MSGNLSIGDHVYARTVGKVSELLDELDAHPAQICISTILTCAHLIRCMDSEAAQTILQAIADEDFDKTFDGELLAKLASAYERQTAKGQA